MPEYLLELYVSADDPEHAATDANTVRDAAEALALQGTPVRYRDSMFISDEETFFVLLEAESIEAVRAVAGLAGVSCDRISVVTSHHSSPAEQQEQDLPARVTQVRSHGR